MKPSLSKELKELGRSHYIIEKQMASSQNALHPISLQSEWQTSRKQTRNAGLDVDKGEPFHTHTAGRSVNSSVTKETSTEGSQTLTTDRAQDPLLGVPRKDSNQRIAEILACEWLSQLSSTLRWLTMGPTNLGGQHGGMNTERMQSMHTVEQRSYAVCGEMGATGDNLIKHIKPASGNKKTNKKTTMFSFTCGSWILYRYMKSCMSLTGK